MLENFHEKNPWWGPVLIKLQGLCTKTGFHRGCFPGNFPKSVEQSFRYL